MIDKIKAAFVCFGEVNTPREIINKKCNDAVKELEKIDFDIVSNDIVSDDPEGSQAQKAIENISKKNYNLIIFCIAGWIPSHAVITVADMFSHKPMILWGLAGYYENGVLKTTADQAGTSALRKVFEDMKYTFKYIYESPGKPPKLEEIKKFALAAKTAALMRQSKIGMMGYKDMNLYGTLYDGVSLKSKIGVEIEHFEMLEIKQLLEKLETREIMEVMDSIKKAWKFEGKVSDNTLRTGVEFYLALKQKIISRKYKAVSLIDVDGMKKLLGFPPAMIFMLLADNLGVCAIPENDVPGSVTQLITKYLTGQIGAYMEFYEFMEDRVLAGVPDFVPGEVVDGPIRVLPTKFGDLNEGVLNVSKVKAGNVTLCRLASTGDRYSMHIVTGRAVQPGKWEEIGWTPPAPQLPSLEIFLDRPVEEFAQNVMSQHYIISYGNNLDLYRDYCQIAGINIIS